MNDPFDPFNAMYTDMFLKFKDAAEADSVLFDVSEEPVYGPSDTEFDESAEFTYTFKVNGEPCEFISTEEIPKEQLLDTCKKVYYGDDPEDESDKFTYMRLASTNKTKTPKTVQIGIQKVKRPRYSAVDEIGTIYKPTGKLLPSDSGDAVDEMAPLPGWHVNVRHAGEAAELTPHQVFPKTPSRLWL